MPKKKQKSGIHLYRTIGSMENGWYWNLIARNGRELARSSEVYSSKRSAVKSIQITAFVFGSKYIYFDHTGDETEIVSF